MQGKQFLKTRDHLQLFDTKILVGAEKLRKVFNMKIIYIAIFVLLAQFGGKTEINQALKMTK